MKKLRVTSSGPVSRALVLIAVCFSLRDRAHWSHLQTSSYAEHKALNEFYTSIIDLTDQFAEAYQGIHGRFTGFTYGMDLVPKQFLSNANILPLIVEFQRWLTDEVVPQIKESSLLNILDDILTLAARTQYQLENLS